MSRLILSNSGEGPIEHPENLSADGAGAARGSAGEGKPKNSKEMQQPTSPQTPPAAEKTTISQIYEMIAQTREREL